MGSTQRPRDATRERCADDGSPSGDHECAASDLSLMYAGDRGRKERRSSNHRRCSSERALGRVGSLRGGGAIRRRRAPSGARNDAVGFPLGADLLASHCSFGARVGCGRDAFLRECIGAERDRSRSSFRGGSRGAERTSLRVGSDRHPASRRPSGRRRAPDARSQTRPRLLAFLRLFGSGTPKRLEPRGETSSTETSGRRETRGSIGNVSIQSPWEHRAVRSRKAAWPQRTPRWNKALRSTGWKARRGDTRAGSRRTARGNASR